MMKKASMGKMEGTKEMKNSRIVDARGASPVVGLAPGTISNLARAGKIPSIKLPSGARRYDVGDLQRFVEAHKVGPTVNGNTAGPDE